MQSSLQCDDLGEDGLVTSLLNFERVLPQCRLQDA